MTRDKRSGLKITERVVHLLRTSPFIHWISRHFLVYLILMVKLSVIETRCRGRMVVGASLIAAGTVVVLEDPIACVPLPTSSLPDLSCSAGVHCLTKTELAMKNSTFLSSSSLFTGNLCILAARFYLYGRSHRLTKGAATERYETIRNHMTAEQAQGLSGMNECAILVQRLIAQTLHKEERSHQDSYGEPTIAECTEVICKLCCNLFTITDDFQNEAGIGCYPRAALLNHSCEPNCIQRFDSQANIVIRAVCDIPAGTELTISYIDTGMPTWHRQQELLKSCYFNCTCSRCVQVDANDVYACSNLTCARQHREKPTGKNRNTILTERGSYIISEKNGSSVYSTWLDAVSASNLSSSASASPAPLPFPQYATSIAGSGILPTSIQLRCQRCGTHRSLSDVRSSVSALCELQRQFDSFVNSIDYKHYSTAEQLYVQVKHALYVLSSLQHLVLDHHYCVYHVRKQLKIAFEEHLPVRNGVLLFPPVRVQANVENVVKNCYVHEQAKGINTNAKPGLMMMTSTALRQIYEENLVAILQIIPYCYAACVPNLCYTFYRIQFVWYMLSKADSLISTWPGPAATIENSSRDVSAADFDIRDDVPTLRRLAAQSKELLQTVKVVYGADHAFYADMQHCAMQLQRMCV